MKLLLDTCCMIWCVSNPERIPESIKSLIIKDSSSIYISPISCAEIACLVERNRIVIDVHWKTWFNKYIALNQWEIINIGIDIIQEAYSLPGDFHQDPADRIITATARVHDLILLTADRKILDYPHVNAQW